MVYSDSYGTKHRNHCPLCLWSKHVDLKTPGDRRSDCDARMQPVGLTMKDIKYNPFTHKTSGELMIVHKCLKCGRTSCNRIAGDDNPYTVLSLLEKLQLQTGITMLTMEDEEQVLTALFGYNHPDI